MPDGEGGEGELKLQVALFRRLLVIIDSIVLDINNSGVVVGTGRFYRQLDPEHSGVFGFVATELTGAVAEPHGAALMAFGLLAAFAARSRRKR